MINPKRIVLSYITGAQALPQGIDTLLKDPVLRKNAPDLVQALQAQPDRAQEILQNHPYIKKVQVLLRDPAGPGREASLQDTLNRARRSTGLALGTLALISGLSFGATPTQQAPAQAPQQTQQAPRSQDQVLDSVKTTPAYKQLLSSFKIPGPVLWTVATSKPETVVKMGIKGFMNTMRGSMMFTINDDVKKALSQLNTPEERAAALTGAIISGIESSKANNNFQYFSKAVGSNAAIGAIKQVATEAAQKANNDIEKFKSQPHR